MLEVVKTHKWLILVKYRKVLGLLTTKKIWIKKKRFKKIAEKKNSEKNKIDKKILFVNSIVLCIKN